jgi:hypothetical protein
MRPFQQLSAHNKNTLKDFDGKTFFQVFLIKDERKKGRKIVKDEKPMDKAQSDCF